MAKRKKANKADELYVKANLGKEIAEISLDIDLDEDVVLELLTKAKRKTFADNARITSNGQKIGSTLTQQMAEYVPPQVDKSVAPHIYKTDTGFQFDVEGETG